MPEPPPSVICKVCNIGRGWGGQLSNVYVWGGGGVLPPASCLRVPSPWVILKYPLPAAQSLCSHRPPCPHRETLPIFSFPGTSLPNTHCSNQVFCKLEGGKSRVISTKQSREQPKSECFPSNHFSSSLWRTHPRTPFSLPTPGSSSSCAFAWTDDRYLGFRYITQHRESAFFEVSLCPGSELLGGGTSKAALPFRPGRHIKIFSKQKSDSLLKTFASALTDSNGRILKAAFLPSHTFKHLYIHITSGTRGYYSHFTDEETGSKEINVPNPPSL